MKTNNVSIFGMLCLSISSIIGCGWLFAGFLDAKIAGPAAIISWIIGGLLIIIVALPFSEIFSLIPISGASARIPQFTHGKIIGMFASLTAWLTYLTLLVIQIQSVILYLSFFIKGLSTNQSQISGYGEVLFIIILIGLSIINTFSANFASLFNIFLTFIKFAVPIAIGITIILLFAPHRSFMHPYGSAFAPSGIHGILAAISTGGIIFSFSGFQFPCEMGGEIKNPKFSIPFSIIFSIFICVIFFLILQLSFILGIHSSDIKQGWNALSIGGNSSPFASILLNNNLWYLIPYMYIGIIVSPLASSLVYCACASRSVMGLAINGAAPKILAKTNKNKVPYLSIWLNFLIAVLLSCFFNFWQATAELLTFLFSIAFILGAISLISLRQKAPEMLRRFKLPNANLFGYASLYTSTLFLYWLGWNMAKKAIYFIIFCLIFFLFVQIYQKWNKSDIISSYKESSWLWFYICSVMIASYAGNYSGGHHILSDYIIMCYFMFIVFITIWLSRKYNNSNKDLLNNDFFRSSN